MLNPFENDVAVIDKERRRQIRDELARLQSELGEIDATKPIGDESNAKPAPVVLAMPVDPVSDFELLAAHYDDHQDFSNDPERLNERSQEAGQQSYQRRFDDLSSRPRSVPD